MVVAAVFPNAKIIVISNKFATFAFTYKPSPGKE